MHSTNHDKYATADKATATPERHPADLVRIVDRVGWHGRAYVLPRQTLGNDGGEALMFQSEAQIEGGMSQRGSLDQWKDRIGRGGRDYLQRWRATINGLEAMAAQHSDALLCIDELGQLEARVATAAAHRCFNAWVEARPAGIGMTEGDAQ